MSSGCLAKGYTYINCSQAKLSWELITDSKKR